jgi:DNA modification methylase
MLSNETYSDHWVAMMSVSHGVSDEGSLMAMNVSANVPVTKKTNGNANKLDHADRAFHDWYRFVLSYPPHLVREYFSRFGLQKGQTVLDPFCGTGTTVVEAKLQGLKGIGIEANKMAWLAGTAKTDWSIDPDGFLGEARRCADEARKINARARKLRRLGDEQGELLLSDSICPVPLHKSLILLSTIDKYMSETFSKHARTALAKTLVFSASNLHFGPEVGVRGRKEDADVVGSWMSNIEAIASDIAATNRKQRPKTVIHEADSRDPSGFLKPGSIDAVFTSPPYPNEKDYTRTTRLETVLLGFVNNNADLRAIKKGLLRSNTRGVYKEDGDDAWVAGNANIQIIANEIERRRIALGKDSGFERLYPRVTKLYFGGMARHLAALRPFLKPGAMLGYVVGDQASYLQVMIRTGTLLGEIAEKLGYKVESIDLFRTRIATATNAQMREEVLVLRWPGA